MNEPSFDQQMIDLHLSVNQAYAVEVRKLRQENAKLRAVIANGPVVIFELQERVTMLECLLERAHGIGITGGGNG